MRKFQFRRDTTANWAAANPTLADGEPGFDKTMRLLKIGDGVTAWNALAFWILSALADIITLASQAVAPAAPASGSLKVYARSLGGRELLRQIGPSGQATPLQPSFFQNSIYYIGTSRTTALGGIIGNSSSATGTQSTVLSEALGWMANYVTAGTAAAAAGVSFTDNLFIRGTQVGGSNGFFNVIRGAFPDSSYDQSGAGTGSRLFAGMSSSALTAVPAADTVPIQTVGFMRRNTDTGPADANWQFVSRDSQSVQTIVDTGIAFVPNHVYDFALFCAPGVGNPVSWTVIDVTAGTRADGSATATLPDAGVAMKAGIAVVSVNAVARNVRMKQVYVETDR